MMLLIHRYVIFFLGFSVFNLESSHSGGELGFLYFPVCSHETLLLRNRGLSIVKPKEMPFPSPFLDEMNSAIEANYLETDDYRSSTMG